MNHSDILALFRRKVAAHFTAIKLTATTKADRSAAASRATMLLYKPGDTRMLTVFRMLARVLFLLEPLVATFNDTTYDALAQKCIKNYNAQCKDNAKKITMRDTSGKLVDVAKANFGSSTAPLYTEIEEWLQLMTSSVFFHRTVDTHKPSLFLVYYTSALVDKHLRILGDLGKAREYAADVHAAFMQRWERYHRPCHTLAYHMAPQFHLHTISDEEKIDCLKACKQFWPDQAQKVYKGLLQFKTKAVQSKVDKTEWDEAETDLPHVWYDAYGMSLGLPEYTAAAMQLTSKAASASVAEQGVTGWSKVGSIETDKRTRILTSKTSKLVSVGGWQWSLKQRARMLSDHDRKDQLKLFDALDTLIGKDQDEARKLGLTEGGDDDEDEEMAHSEADNADADAHADAADPVPIPDLPEACDEYVQELAVSEEAILQQDQAYVGAEETQEEEDDSEGEDLSEIEEPSGPRTDLRVNASLEAALEGVPNIRATNFNSAKRLTFAE